VFGLNKLLNILTSLGIAPACPSSCCNVSRETCVIFMYF